MLTNCVNCGAPLHGSTCEYCGTRYAGNKVQACFGEGQAAGTLTVGGNEYKVYLGKMEAFSTEESVGRDLNGQFHRVKGRMVHKFMLIER
nr:MAG TPA: alpha-aminoadipate carrier protein [Caudoviricetes sp.]